MRTHLASFAKNESVPITVISLPKRSTLLFSELPVAGQLTKLFFVSGRLQSSRFHHLCRFILGK